MTAVLLDTHVWWWLFSSEQSLPAAAEALFEEAEAALVCTISIYEIARKAAIGKWPGVDAALLDRLLRESASAGVTLSAPGPAALSLERDDFTRKHILS